MTNEVIKMIRDGEDPGKIREYIETASCCNKCKQAALRHLEAYEKTLSYF